MGSGLDTEHFRGLELGNESRVIFWLGTPTRNWLDNSTAQFTAHPNSDIEFPILDFPILGPIQCIQTQYYYMHTAVIPLRDLYLLGVDSTVCRY